MLSTSTVVTCRTVIIYFRHPVTHTVLFFLSGSSLFSRFKRGDEKIGKEYRSAGSTIIYAYDEYFMLKNDTKSMYKS